MANITTGNSFTTGDQVTAASLNLAFSGAVLAAGSVDASTIQLTGSGFPVLSVKDGGLGYAKLSTGAPAWTSAGVVTITSLDGLTVSKGSNNATVPATYAASITHKNNTTGKYGLIVGTNWGASENIIANFGLYDAASGVFTSYFKIDGTGVSTLTGAITTTASVNTGTQGYKVSTIKVVGAQELAEADVSATAAITGSDTVNETTVLASINALETKVNNLLAKLRTHGLIAT